MRCVLCLGSKEYSVTLFDIEDVRLSRSIQNQIDVLREENQLKDYSEFQATQHIIDFLKMFKGAISIAPLNKFYPIDRLVLEPLSDRIIEKIAKDVNTKFECNTIYVSDKIMDLIIFENKDIIMNSMNVSNISYEKLFEHLYLNYDIRYRVNKTSVPNIVVKNVINNVKLNYETIFIYGKYHATCNIIYIDFDSYEFMGIVAEFCSKIGDDRK